MKKKYGIIALLIALVFGGGYGVSTLGGGVDSFGCSVSTVSAVSVGNQNSVTILTNSSNRAWARIQQVNNATNTAYLSFDEGANATVDNGILLASSTTPIPQHIEFGLNTDFPYLGEVTGITNTGSSTLLVTECKY